MNTTISSIQTQFDEAVRLYDIGKYTESASRYGDVLALFIAHEIDDYVFLINIYIGMGASKHMGGDEEGALDAYCKAQAVVEMLYGRGSEAGLPLLLNKALSLLMLKRAGEAINELSKAKSLVGKVKQCVEREAFSAALMHNTAIAYMALERPKEAIQEFKAALRLEERIHGKEHAEYARTLFGIGEAYETVGATSLALESLLESDKIRSTVGCTPVELGKTRLAIAQLYVLRNEIKKATRYAQSALLLLEPSETEQFSSSSSSVTQTDARALKAVKGILRFINGHEQAARQRRVRDGEVV